MSQTLSKKEPRIQSPGKAQHKIEPKTLTASSLMNIYGEDVNAAQPDVNLLAVNSQAAAELRNATIASEPDLISATQAAEQGRQWAELQSCGDRLCWLEFDATLGATRIRLRQRDQSSILITPSSFSVRSRVHEYGGGSFRLVDDAVVFVNDRDQGLYWQRLPSSDADQLQPPRLLRQTEGFRYGDLQYDRLRQRIIAVEEQHGEQGVINRLVGIGLPDLLCVPDHQVAIRKVLVQGDDFYSSPRLSVDGSQLAWISWNHPEQPWTATQLWLGGLDSDGVPQGQQRITSGSYQGRSESVVQPEFGPDGALFFLSDRSGWWNLYRYLVPANVNEHRHNSGSTDRCSATGKRAPKSVNRRVAVPVDALLLRSSEFCRAPWQLGQQAYVVIDAQHVGCSWWQDGKAQLGLLQLDKATAPVYPGQNLTPLGCWAAVHSLNFHNGQLVAFAESSVESGQLVSFGLSGQPLAGDDWQASVVERIDGSEPISCSDSAVARAATRVTTRVTTVATPAVVEAEHVVIDVEGRAQVYGLLYRPQPVDAAEPRPTPLIIQLHGGPTAQADGRFDPLKQFWLQRGFALLDLNYRGSTGYGREYRQQLKGQWGVSDVEDVTSAARFFSAQGWVDPQRIVVRGNSAGGYTCLQVLSNADGQQWLRTGASHYGISDLQRLAAETHKFESRYLDWLIGDPVEDQQRYRARSPIHRPQSFCRPLIFFQGGLDRVVPATQTYTLYNQLKGRGLDVEYLAFADERHGFRQAKNRATVLQREWQFYQQQLEIVEVLSSSSRCE
ncbi:MAG: prolyl oligopeptidase family serine peptidase [Motiliproteus sp.]